MFKGPWSSGMARPWQEKFQGGWNRGFDSRRVHFIYGEFMNEYELNREFSCKYYDPNQSELKAISKIASLKNKAVLDLCCGNGRLSFPLARKAKQVIGIDSDKKIIKLCKKKLLASKAKNLSFKLMNAKKLSFPKNFFDIVLIAWHTPSIKELKQAFKVLKKKGQLILLNPVNSIDFSEAISFLPKKKRDLKKTYFNPVLKIFKNLKVFKKASIPYEFPNALIAEKVIVFSIRAFNKKKLHQEQLKALKKKLIKLKHNNKLIINEPVICYAAVKK